MAQHYCAVLPSSLLPENHPLLSPIAPCAQPPHAHGGGGGCCSHALSGISTWNHKSYHFQASFERKGTSNSLGPLRVSLVEHNPKASIRPHTRTRIGHSRLLETLKPSSRFELLNCREMAPQGYSAGNWANWKSSTVTSKLATKQLPIFSTLANDLGTKRQRSPTGRASGKDKQSLRLQLWLLYHSFTGKKAAFSVPRVVLWCALLLVAFLFTFAVWLFHCEQDQCKVLVIKFAMLIALPVSLRFTDRRNCSKSLAPFKRPRCPNGCLSLLPICQRVSLGWN